MDLTWILDNIGVTSNEYYEYTNSKEISNKTLMNINARKKTDVEMFSNLGNELCKNCFVKIEK